MAIDDGKIELNKPSYKQEIAAVDKFAEEEGYTYSKFEELPEVAKEFLVQAYSDVMKGGAELRVFQDDDGSLMVLSPKSGSTDSFIGQFSLNTHYLFTDKSSYSKYIRSVNLEDVIKKGVNEDASVEEPFVIKLSPEELESDKNSPEAIITAMEAVGFEKAEGAPFQSEFANAYIAKENPSANRTSIPGYWRMKADDKQLIVQIAKENEHSHFSYYTRDEDIDEWRHIKDIHSLDDLPGSALEEKPYKEEIKKITDNMNALDYEQISYEDCTPWFKKSLDTHYLNYGTMERGDIRIFKAGNMRYVLTPNPDEKAREGTFTTDYVLHEYEPVDIKTGLDPVTVDMRTILMDLDNGRKDGVIKNASEYKKAIETPQAGKAPEFVIEDMSGPKYVIRKAGVGAFEVVSTGAKEKAKPLDTFYDKDGVSGRQRAERYVDALEEFSKKSEFRQDEIGELLRKLYENKKNLEAIERVRQDIEHVPASSFDALDNQKKNLEESLYQNEVANQVEGDDRSFIIEMTQKGLEQLETKYQEIQKQIDEEQKTRSDLAEYINSYEFAITDVGVPVEQLDFVEKLFELYDTDPVSAMRKDQKMFSQLHESSPDSQEIKMSLQGVRDLEELYPRSQNEESGEQRGILRNLREEAKEVREKMQGLIDGHVGEKTKAAKEQVKNGEAYQDLAGEYGRLKFEIDLAKEKYEQEKLVSGDTRINKISKGLERKTATLEKSKEKENELLSGFLDEEVQELYREKIADLGRERAIIELEQVLSSASKAEPDFIKNLKGLIAHEKKMVEQESESQALAQDIKFSKLFEDDLGLQNSIPEEPSRGEVIKTEGGKVVRETAQKNETLDLIISGGGAIASSFAQIRENVSGDGAAIDGYEKDFMELLSGVQEKVKADDIKSMNKEEVVLYNRLETVSIDELSQEFVVKKTLENILADISGSFSIQRDPNEVNSYSLIGSPELFGQTGNLLYGDLPSKNMAGYVRDYVTNDVLLLLDSVLEQGQDLSPDQQRIFEGIKTDPAGILRDTIEAKWGSVIEHMRTAEEIIGKYDKDGVFALEGDTVAVLDGNTGDLHSVAVPGLSNYTEDKNVFVDSLARRVRGDLVTEKNKFIEGDIDNSLMISVLRNDTSAVEGLVTRHGAEMMEEYRQVMEQRKEDERQAEIAQYQGEIQEIEQELSPQGTLTIEVENAEREYERSYKDASSGVMKKIFRAFNKPESIQAEIDKEIEDAKTAYEEALRVMYNAELHKKNLENQIAVSEGRKTPSEVLREATSYALRTHQGEGQEKRSFVTGVYERNPGKYGSNITKKVSDYWSKNKDEIMDNSKTVAKAWILIVAAALVMQNPNNGDYYNASSMTGATQSIDDTTPIETSTSTTATPEPPPPISENLIESYSQTVSEYGFTRDMISLEAGLKAQGGESPWLDKFTGSNFFFKDDVIVNDLKLHNPAASGKNIEIAGRTLKPGEEFYALRGDVIQVNGGNTARIMRGREVVYEATIDGEETVVAINKLPIRKNVKELSGSPNN